MCNKVAMLCVITIKSFRGPQSWNPYIGFVGAQERGVDEEQRIFLADYQWEWIEPFNRKDNPLRFGVQLAKLKIFTAGTDVDPVEMASELLDDMSLMIEDGESVSTPTKQH